MMRKRAFVLLGGAALAAVAAVVAFHLLRGPRDADEGLLQPAVGFTGNSTELKRTVIVPTLDTPFPKDKNAIWCASFQLAWNRLANDVIKGPPEVANAEEVAARLNAANVTEADLPESSFYAAAGFTADGIVEKICQEMQSRFGKQPKIELNQPGTAIVAYGHLEASVRFRIPFFDNDKDFLFQEPDGEETAVASFGLREKDEYAYDKLREQVEILHYVRGDDGAWEAKEFVVDPCRSSSPNQMILACVEPKETLAATWDAVLRLIERQRAQKYRLPFRDGDGLLIPDLNWDIAHHFAELEGNDKRLKNPGFEDLWCDAALQTIRFTLDRGGAELSSEAGIAVKEPPCRYYFNRPFLIAIRKRGCEQPFFVMWVANSELLLRK